MYNKKEAYKLGSTQNESLKEGYYIFRGRPDYVNGNIYPVN